ncbi:MAG: tripartite tricarboxylate transporter substrate binding protein [Betaproteobacteria bacterium]|nr:tripartite tricarboxylate transporter substrate binding protein [Betaproteobacteria bacterium]
MMLAFAAANANAQGYPNKPIRMVVPFPAGGSVDTVARAVGQKLGESLKQSVLVDNRGGAGGNLGADAVAKAAPDGYTLLITTPGLAIARSIYRKLPFDPVTDFAPVSQLTSTYLILVVNQGVPARSVTELIALAKAQPGKLNYGSSGSGATIHLATELFKTKTGIEIVHVPYKGEAPAYIALLANEVQMVVGPVSGLLPQIKAGKLRALAVSSSMRAAAIPDIPTIAEAGVPNFEFTSWFGMFAPAGTAREIISRLSGEFARIMTLPDIREPLPSMGNEPVGSTPEQFTAKYKSDIAQYAVVIKAAGVPLAD